MERVMVTLPKELLITVDAAAKCLKQNRSQFVRQALAEKLDKMRRQEFEALLAEGYQEMAEEGATLTIGALPWQAMAAEKVWQWDE